MNKDLAVEQLLLTPEEAAESLRISRSKIYALMKKQEIPSLKIWGSTRIPAEQLRVWIARQVIPTTDQGGR